jgi:hypothetical protein
MQEIAKPHFIDLITYSHLFSYFETSKDCFLKQNTAEELSRWLREGFWSSLDPIVLVERTSSYIRNPHYICKCKSWLLQGSELMNDSGLEADQKVIAAHGCYAMTATTALTAQNTLGVTDIHQTPPAFVQKLIDACISDIGADVVKTGSLDHFAM